MKKQKTETRPKNSPIAVRFTDDQIKDIEAVAESFQMSKQDVIRLSVSAGLKAMRQIGLVGIHSYLSKAITDPDASSSPSTSTPPRPLSLVAESQASYGNYEIPFLGSAAAGEPVEAPRDEVVRVPRRYPTGFFVVEVNGQSMEPTLTDGSRVVIDGNDKFTPKDGAICVISDGLGSSIKRWNRKEGLFKSDNPKYGDHIGGDECTLQGYLVEVLPG